MARLVADPVPILMELVAGFERRPQRLRDRRFERADIGAARRPDEADLLDVVPGAAPCLALRRQRRRAHAFDESVEVIHRRRALVHRRRLPRVVAVVAKAPLGQAGRFLCKKARRFAILESMCQPSSMFSSKPSIANRSLRSISWKSPGASNLFSPQP